MRILQLIGLAFAFWLGAAICVGGLVIMFRVSGGRELGIVMILVFGVITAEIGRRFWVRFKERPRKSVYNRHFDR